jgi:hypothetical protein
MVGSNVNQDGEPRTRAWNVYGKTQAARFSGFEVAQAQ